MRKCVAPSLLAGILSATAVPALAAEPSPAALQIVQQALESSSAQKSDAVPLLDKAINTWKKEKLPTSETELYRVYKWMLTSMDNAAKHKTGTADPDSHCKTVMFTTSER